MFISERRHGNHWLPNNLLESRMFVLKKNGFKSPRHDSQNAESKWVNEEHKIQNLRGVCRVKVFLHTLCRTDSLFHREC